MGSAMAANLAKAGYRVHGYDILPARRAALKKAGGTPQPSIARVARAAEVLITSLPSAAALHAVAAEISARGRVVMETSTLPIEEKDRARDTLAKKGVVLLDCPLSGTGAQARTRDLVVYASGDRKAYARAEPFIPGFSRAQHYLGAFGNGSKMKFVANLLVAIHNVSAAEAFVLGMKAGLAPGTIYKVQAESAGSSRSRRWASTSVSSPCVSSCPMLRRPTRGLDVFEMRRAYALPMTPKRSRSSAPQRTVAPTSSKRASGSCRAYSGRRG